MMDNAQEFYVYNPVKQNKGIGRRTGKPVYKKRNIYNGVDNFEDYFTDSDDEASINVTKHLQLSAAEGAESSQVLKDVLSSEKSGATQTRDLSFREDVASKSIQQLPPEKFDSVRIFNPLTLGSRFGRRTGKDVLAGKVLTGGVDNFSAFLSDNTDISISMQATPTQSTSEQLSPFTSAKKSGGILSSKKSRDRSLVLVNTDSHMRVHVESFSATSSEQQCSQEQCSQEVLEPAFEEQGISHLQVPECIITAVEVEHVGLVLGDASSNDAKSKRLQGIDKRSTNVDSIQRLFENPSIRASLNASKVKNSLHDDGQAWVSLSISKEDQTWPEKDSLKTLKVKTCHNDDEQAQLGLSLSKAAQTWSEKENLMPEADKQVGRLDKTEEVQTTCGDSEDSNNLGKKEAADIYQHTSAEEHMSAEEEHASAEEEHASAEEEHASAEEEHASAEEEHTSAEESTKTVSGVQKVVPIQQSQPSVVKQAQHLEFSKGHKTQPGVSLLLQSTDVQAQESTGISGGTESLIASLASSSGQTNPSIAAASFRIPSVSNTDRQSHSERSLQTTDLTGRQGAARHMTKSSAALNFGGDVTGSVSRSEQAVGGQFFGIKKRLSYSYALTEGEQPSVQSRQNVETARLAKAVPREKKTIVSFLGQHDRVNSDYQFTASETGTFVTLAPRRISQLTSDAELLSALNTSTDNPDDFCIVEEESIVYNSSAVANKHQSVNSKADKKQLRHKRNNKSSPANQEKMDVQKQQTDVLTDSQEGNNCLQANQDSLLEENQVTNLLKKRKSMKSAGTILDGPDTSFEARTLISLTSQQVTGGADHRRKKVQGGPKFNKRKVKHSIEDEASPPKQIKCNEEQDTGTEVQEKDIDSELLHKTKLLKLQATKISKIKHNKKEGSLGKQAVKQLKENKVSNTIGKRSNLSDKVGARNRKKVGKKPIVPDKPNNIEKNVHASPEENSVVGYLNTRQNNPLEMDNEESKNVLSKTGKSSKQNKGKGLSRELKQLQDTKLPKLKRSQRNRKKVLGSECNSDNSSSDLLQQESVTIQNPTADTVTEDNSPVLKNSQQYRFRSRHTAKSRQHPSVTQSGQHPSVTQSEQHPSVTQSEQHPSVTQSEQHPSVTQSGQHPSVTQSEQHPSVTQLSHSVTQLEKHPSVAQSEQHPSVTQSEQYREPSVSQTATVAKITKQKRKGSRRNKTGKGKQNQTSGRSKARGIQENRKLSRLATHFNPSAMFENITEEESNICDSSFHNTAHSIAEVNVSKNNPSVDEDALVDVPRSRKETIKNVKNTTLEKTCTENYIDSQAISYVQGCDVNHEDNSSAEKNADSRKSVDVSVPLELLENKKKVASRKSVCGKVRRAGKSLSGNTSAHSESGQEVCSPPKLQLISSLPNVTPQSGISFRRSGFYNSDLSDAGSFSPPTVPKVPTRDEACFTPRLKEQKTPVISSCLKNADSSVRPRRKGRRVRISSIINQKMYSPVESEISDSPSVATTSLLSVNSSPVHYAETTTNNITLTSKGTEVTLPDLSYKIIRPEASHVEGLRRSTRTRVMRLNTDRGEEIIYRRDSSGFGLVVDSIQPSIGEARVKAAEERRRKMLKKRKLKAMIVPAKPAKRLSTHWKVNDIISSSTEIPVINPDNNEEVLLELIAHADSATWYGPDLTPVTGTEPVALCLHLKQQMFTTGEVNIRGLAEKPCELTIHTLIMYVICGKILLRINGVSTVVDTGGSFFIPRGTSYFIKNLRRDIAKLYFVDIDDADRENSFPKSYSMSVTSDHME